MDIIDEVAFHGSEQLACALQIIAALVLTDEEVLASNPDAREGNLVGWAKSMREELLNESYRPQLVALLKKQGFYTNTHPGFPLGPLSSPCPRTLQLGMEACQKLADSIRAGDLEYDYNCEVDPMVALLVQDGIDESVATWIVNAHGKSMFLMASMDRMCGRQ